MSTGDCPTLGLPDSLQQTAQKWFLPLVEQTWRTKLRFEVKPVSSQGKLFIHSDPNASTPINFYKDTILEHLP